MFAQSQKIGKPNNVYVISLELVVL